MVNEAAPHSTVAIAERSSLPLVLAILACFVQLWRIADSLESLAIGAKPRQHQAEQE